MVDSIDLNNLSFNTYNGDRLKPDEDVFNINNSNNLIVNGLELGDRFQGNGNDRITMNGGNGDDAMRLSNSSFITANGQAGNDRLIGEFCVSFDAIGGIGEDFFAGRSVAGSNRNAYRFTGGINADTFELPFYDNGSGVAIITDFQPGVDFLGVSGEFLGTRSLDSFKSNRVTFKRGARASFLNRNGAVEPYDSPGVFYDNKLVAVLVGTTFSDASNANFVVTNSPFF
jgi:hypothetical protein